MIKAQEEQVGGHTGWSKSHQALRPHFFSMGGWLEGFLDGCLLGGWWWGGGGGVGGFGVGVVRWLEGGVGMAGGGGGVGCGVGGSGLDGGGRVGGKVGCGFNGGWCASGGWGGWCMK